MVARVARQKRAGTYKRGMNLDDDEDDGDTYTNTKKSRKDSVCQFCGLVGHSTTRSKKCLQNPNSLLPEQQQQGKAEEESEDDGAQDNEADELDLFYDVGTWSDGEEDRLASCFV